MSFVYILKTTSGKYYIGSTNDLDARMKHHKGGYTKSTKALGEVELIFKQEYYTLGEARRIERRLKNLKRKDYIENIIRDGYIKMSP